MRRTTNWQTRERRIQVLCTDEQFAAIQRMADAKGLSMSTWLLSVAMALDDELFTIDPESFPEQDGYGSRQEMYEDLWARQWFVAPGVDPETLWSVYHRLADGVPLIGEGEDGRIEMTRRQWAQIEGVKRLALMRINKLAAGIVEASAVTAP